MQLQQLGDVAEKQYGLITRSQMLEFFTEHQLRDILRRRLVEPVRLGVYRMHGSPNSWHQRLLAILLSSPHYVVSHRAAARLHDLGNHWQAEILEVSTHQHGRHSLKDVEVHKAPLPLHHTTVVDGIRVTTIARTLVDLAATSHPAAVARALDHALRLHLVRLDHLDAVLSEIARPGLPRIGKIRKLLAARREHLTHSDLERDVLKWIRKAGLTAPVAQHPVPTEICTYHLDLAYPDAMVGIEADGFSVHANRSAFDDDARRNSAIAAAGWRILPVTTRTRETDFIRDLRQSLRPPKREIGAECA
jgi:very-short-patch-repair endonuclease